MGVQGFWQSTGPIIGIREPSPLKLVPNKRLDIVFLLYSGIRDMPVSHFCQNLDLSKAPTDDKWHLATPLTKSCR